MPSTDPPTPNAAAPAAPRVHALVPAAGRGERFGSGTPKQFQPVAGRALLAWTVHRLLDAGCASVVVALPPDAVETGHGLDDLADEPRLRRVAGAATRQASVAEALAASPAGPDDLVAVHDGARAALAPSDFAATVNAALSTGGAVLGRRSTDTMKELDEDSIVGSVDRRRIFRAETPQVFRRSVLERALEAARRDRFVGTDESMLVERLGGVRIVAVEARRPNPKVTYPEDLALVERIVSAEASR